MQKPDTQNDPWEQVQDVQGADIIVCPDVSDFNCLKYGCVICNMKANQCLPLSVTTGFKWKFFLTVNDSVLMDDDGGQVVASHYRTTVFCAKSNQELV